jgi:C-terminal processing protease CtpA/Prc
VKVGELPNTDKLAKSGSDANDDKGTLNGVAVADLDGRRDVNTRSRNVQGALITEVDESSAAAEAGISAGDVILEINREKVTSPGCSSPDGNSRRQDDACEGLEQRRRSDSSSWMKVTSDNVGENTS